jgi:hypothetical protein
VAVVTAPPRALPMPRRVPAASNIGRRAEPPHMPRRHRWRSDRALVLAHRAKIEAPRKSPRPVQVLPAPGVRELKLKLGLALGPRRNSGIVYLKG